MSATLPARGHLLKGTTVTGVFTPGTHLRVHRRVKQVGPPYWHHGIYVSDSEIIEFGGSKPMVRVRTRSLAEFRSGDSVEVVKHPVIWRGQTYSPPLPPDQVIDRSQWLLHNQPPSYQLGYRNCETVANWCATGDFESFQVKGFLGWKSAAFLPTVVLLRRKPSVGKWVGLASIGLSLLTAIPYIHSRALFDHVGRYPGIGDWSALEE